MARILLVDDEDTVRSYLSVLVTRFGHEAVTAATAAEALEKARMEQFGLIIADIRLPDAPIVDQWVHQIKDAGAGTPVILISGAPTPELEAMAASGLVRAFLSKPFELGFIRNILREVLG